MKPQHAFDTANRCNAIVKRGNGWKVSYPYRDKEPDGARTETANSFTYTRAAQVRARYAVTQALALMGYDSETVGRIDYRLESDPAPARVMFRRALKIAGPRA